MVSNRARGSSGEREACAWLSKHVYDNRVDLKRNIEQVRQGGADIIHYPLIVEVKRSKGVQYLKFTKWWLQVQAAKEKMVLRENKHYEPIVMFRRDKGDWEFLIGAWNLSSIDSSTWIHIDRFLFIRWVKEQHVVVVD